MLATWCTAAAACGAALHTCPHRRSAHVQKQDVTTLEARLHAATEHNNNLRGQQCNKRRFFFSGFCSLPRIPDRSLFAGGATCRMAREQGNHSVMGAGLTGDSLPVNNIRVFQMIRADVTTKPATTMVPASSQLRSLISSWQTVS